MNTAGPWPIPALLNHLIAIGFWPARGNENRQNLENLVSTELIRGFAPEEEHIFFYPPPFTTIAERISHGDDFWKREEANPGGIVFENCVLIGDFGLGSDAPIVLDYTADPSEPEVKRLRWGSKFSENRWIVAASSFGSMCKVLELPPSPKNEEAQQDADDQLPARPESNFS
jgi:hypothetical protein